MKEIDFKILQTLIKAELEVLNIKYIVIFLIINIAIAFINWYFQKNIKNIENTIYKKKVREDRRITIIEEIYKELVNFTYIFDKDEMKNSSHIISDVEKKVSENRLYIDVKMNNKLTIYLDYLKKVLTDFRHKDFKKENEMLRNIEIEFNK